MNSDYRTNITVDLGFEINPLRPVTTYAEVIQNAKCAAPHAHPRAQIISCNSGIMKVIAPKNIWIANPLQSIWIPGGEEHQVYFPNDVKVSTIFIDPSKTGNLPSSSFAFDIPGFLKSLMSKIISFSNPEELTLQQQRIVEVFIDEISMIGPTATFLPTSDDERIKKVTDALIRDVAGKKSIEYYANVACVSTRTLSRLFIQNLGMGFGDWRIRLKLLEAIKRLGTKQPIKEIAFDLGYENTSSFIHIFKKHLGKTPTNYMLDKQSKKTPGLFPVYEWRDRKN